MAKEKFNRNKPHCNIGTIGHVDHWQDVVDGCDHRRCWRRSGGATFTAYDQIDKAPEEKARGITHLDRSRRVRDGANRSLCARRLPRPRRLCEEHDHRRRADGRRDPGRVGC